NYQLLNNPLYIIDNFSNYLDDIDDIEISYSEMDDKSYTIHFSYTLNNIDKYENVKLFVDDISQLVLKGFDGCLNNHFQATFNFPKEYQTSLKQYLMYFEEFLNDLCIETNVSIQPQGLDTILTVEPKNKDEALEKIADALKLYISAPVLASDVSLEEKLQMQTALQKLYANCSHLESQLILKSATINEQNNQLQMQNKIIEATKPILLEVGIKPELINARNILLLDSLKEIKYDKKTEDAKTFWKSLKGSIKIPLLFKATLEIERSKLDE
ncbi:MAG: hypothetical protein JXQ66_02325, partial [Campylobacterales bacterium]|nr:hypothetical protein [Campylobacterales bacterium]